MHNLIVIIYQLIIFIPVVAFVFLIIYALILSIKALKIYIKKNEKNLNS